MKKFSEILNGLENTDHLSKIELHYPDGTAATIENIPGSQGSVKVYHHLLKKYGAITPEAAKDGLAIYAEHTTDAEQNPGKHPNIDRLFTVISSGNNLSATIY